MSIEIYKGPIKIVKAVDVPALLNSRENIYDWMRREQEARVILTNGEGKLYVFLDTKPDERTVYHVKREIVGSTSREFEPEWIGMVGIGFPLMIAKCIGAEYSMVNESVERLLKESGMKSYINYWDK